MPVSEQSLETLREFDPDVLVDLAARRDRVAAGRSPARGGPARDPDRLHGRELGQPDDEGRDPRRARPDDRLERGPGPRGGRDARARRRRAFVAAGAHSHDHWFSWKPSTARERVRRQGRAGDRSAVPALRLLLGLHRRRRRGRVRARVARAARRERRPRARRPRSAGPPPPAELRQLGRSRPRRARASGRVAARRRRPDRPRRARRSTSTPCTMPPAVVGINTTALVDSAIVRRPVFTIVSEDFASTQTGTLHFSYLARDEGGGLLNVAQSWEEHSTSSPRRCAPATPIERRSTISCAASSARTASTARRADRDRGDRGGRGG